MKKNYRVWAKVEHFAFIDVKADSEKEALSIAENAEEYDFTPTIDEEWSIMYDSVDEL